MHMQRRVCFDIDDHQRVYRQHEHVRRLRHRLQLRWRERTAPFLFVLIGLCFYSHIFRGSVFNDGTYVLNGGLWRRVRVRWQCRTADCMQLRSGICVNIHDNVGVRGYHGHMLHNWLRLGFCVCRKFRAASALHVHRRLRLNVYIDDGVCRKHGHVQRLRRRVQLRWWERAACALHLRCWFREYCYNNNDMRWLREHLRCKWVRRGTILQWGASAAVLVHMCYRLR
jgi:hypothetical protein